MEAIDSFFFKGMDKDSDVDLQDVNTYRDLGNMRLISSEGNRFTAESIEGNVLSFQLPDATFKVIGWSRLIDKLIIFSTNSTAGGDGEVGEVTFNGTVGTYRAVYHQSGLNFAREHPIFEDGQVANPETFSINRVYWTDDFNPPRVLDISKLGNIASGNIDEDVIYQVATGPITYNSTIFQTGDLFTGVAGVTTFIGVNTSVVVHISLNQLSWVPETTKGKCRFVKTVKGDLFSGMYQVAFQLENKATGAKSSWSAPSFPVHITPSPTILGAVPTLKDYGRYQGNDSLTPTQKAIIFEISNIDTSFDFLRVVFIRIEGLAAPSNGTIFFESSITGSTMEVKLSGNENLGTVTLEELIEQLRFIRQVKTIASNKNIMFNGNLTFGEDFEFDTSNITIDPFIYSIPSDVIGNTDSSGADVGGGDPEPIQAHKAQLESGVVSGEIIAGGLYIIRGSGSITYNTVLIPQGQTFTGVSGITTFVVTTGAPIVKATIERQNFTGNFDHFDVNDQFWDAQGMTYDKHVKSYMRSETYRIGLLPFDLAGNPMFVRHIVDIQIPAQGTPGFELVEQQGLETLIRNVALRLSAIDVTSIADKISGFSIVRANRDPQIIAQGMLWPTVAEAGSPRFIHPSASTLLDADEQFQLDGRQLNGYLFHSPEYLFEFDGQPDRLQGDFFRIEDYYDTLRPVTGIGDHLGGNETNNFHTYQKFYKSIPTPIGATAKGGTNLRIFDQGGSVNFGDDNAGAGVSIGLGTDILFKNTTKVRNSAGYFAQDRNGRGMKTELVTTANIETALSGYGNVDPGLSGKPLVSLVRPNNNLYGGQSDAAKANTDYIWIGHFQPVNDETFAQNGNSHIYNNVEVFGGDVYVNLFDVGRVVKDNFAEDDGGLGQYSHGMFFPVESRINTGLRFGRHLNKERSWEKQGSTITNLDGLAFTTDDAAKSQPEQFAPNIYNEAYSYDELFIVFPALPLDHQFDNNKPNLVIHSQQKFSGEVIDNWRRFLQNDEREVETRSGEINNLRVKQGRLFYWQNRGIGYLPVQERALLSDALGNPISLGEGGVITRFDENTNYYGNQHQGSLTETPSGYSWFDMRHKAFMFMSTGGGLEELSVKPQKGLHNFFHNEIKGEITTNDIPTIAKGIISTYDPRFKHVLMGFMGVSSQVGSRDKDFTLAWSDADKQFVGFKTGFVPTTMFRFNDKIVSAPPMYGLFPADAVQGNRSYTNGDFQNDPSRVVEGDDIYVNILAFTTPALPAQPSTDPTHWTLVHTNDSIFIENEGPIGRFFGIVHNNNLQAVVNKGPYPDKVFDNFEFTGPNDTNFFTDIICENTDQTAIDNGISVNVNRDYEYRNRRVFSNVPLDANGARMVDNFMLINMIRDNRVNGDPTLSSDNKIKLVSLRTIVDPGF